MLEEREELEDGEDGNQKKQPRRRERLAYAPDRIRAEECDRAKERDAAHHHEAPVREVQSPPYSQRNDRPEKQVGEADCET